MLIFLAILTISVILFAVLLPRAELKKELPQPEDFIPFLWEDAYCQKEIIPIANKAYILNEFTAIQGFAAQHDTGMGYTDIYIRNKKPVTTLSLEISIDAFSSIFDEYGFKRAKHINYEGKILTAGTTLAFGRSAFTVFAEPEGGIIKTIWIFMFGVIGEQDKQSVVQALHFLGSEYGLALANWDSLELFDLFKTTDIEAFLSKYCP